MSHYRYQQWKNFKNGLRFEKVIAKSLVASFLEHSVDEAASCEMMLNLI